MARQTKGLQLEDDAEFQRKEWVVERVAWVLICLFLAAAVVGLFGSGPLSRTTASDPQQSFEVTFERFTRALADTELDVRVRTSVVEDTSVTVFFSDDWISNVNVREITPDPASAIRTDEGIFYEFSTMPDSSLAVTIKYRPARVGLAGGTVRVANSNRADLWQLVYP